MLPIGRLPEDVAGVLVCLGDMPLVSGAQLNQIRKMVGINILIGLLVIITASAGRYL